MAYDIKRQTFSKIVALHSSWLTQQRINYSPDKGKRPDGENLAQRRHVKNAINDLNCNKLLKLATKHRTLKVLKTDTSP